jgi:hypothetical protein
MRQSWERDSAEIALDRAAVAKLLAPVFPGAAVIRFERVSGGLVNTNFKVVLGAGRLRCCCACISAMPTTASRRRRWSAISDHAFPPPSFSMPRKTIRSPAMPIRIGDRREMTGHKHKRQQATMFVRLICHLCSVVDRSASRADARYGP